MNLFLGNPGYHQGGNYLVSAEKVNFLAKTDVVGAGVSRAYKAHGRVLCIIQKILREVIDNKKN